ncbi:MAG TPA: hypothetical protein VFY84_14180 [Jiangellales bacterium]|nr:hypothetical protein [Jiangellales bacterium]
MSRRRIAATFFLSVTVVAVILELVYALDGDKSTRPWTDYLIMLPWWVMVPAALLLSVWLPLHLIVEKRKKERSG